MRFYLTFLLDRFRDIAGRAAADDVFTALIEPAFMEHVKALRIFPLRVDDAQRNLLLLLVRQARAVTLSHVAPPLHEAAVSLAKGGMLVIAQHNAGAPEEVDFIAPVAWQVAMCLVAFPSQTTASCCWSARMGECNRLRGCELVYSSDPRRQGCGAAL